MRSIDLRSKLRILLLIARSQIEAQEDDDKHQERVATQMDRQSLAVAGRVAVEEDLRSRSVAAAPREEVHGDADGFLGLPADVARQHRHAETLRGPEGEDDPVADKQAGAGSGVCVFDRHDDYGADKGSRKQALAGFLRQNGRTAAYGIKKTPMVIRFWFHFLVIHAEPMSVAMITAPRTMARSCVSRTEKLSPLMIIW